MVISLPVFLVAAVLTVTFVLVSFVVFDRLLRIQVCEARPEWERDGCPSGYFWSPPGGRKMSLRARGYLLSQWFYRRPAWVGVATEAARLHGILRLATWLGGIALAPVLLGTARLAVVLARYLFLS